MAVQARRSMVATSASWPFVGREDELGFAAAARRDDGCRGVVVTGAAGVGKTRLAREVLAAAEAEGAATEWVQSTRAAASIPLGAFAGLVPSTVPLDDRLQFFQLCAEALRERSVPGRVVLGVDDAQLLDPTSAALVLHLASSGTAFVIATVRARAPCEDSIVALWKDLEAPLMELQPLSADETRALLESALGGEVAPGVARWAFSASEGRVLYLRELVKGALATGALFSEGGLWRLGSRPEPSPALVELIARSLHGLAEDELDAVRLLALGEPLDVSTVATIRRLSSLKGLEAKGLAVVGPATGAAGAKARLAHPSYGEVVRDMTPTVRGIELRLSLAEAVRADGLRGPGDALRVAGWLEDAGAELDEPLLLAAAREANAAADPDLAERLVRRTHAEAGAEGMLILARAHAMRRRFDEAEAILAGWEGELTTTELAVEYLMERALRVQHLGLRRTEDALRLCDRAEQWFPGADWQDRVQPIRLMVLATNRGAGPSQVIAAAEQVLEHDYLASDIRHLATIAYAFSLHDVGRSADAYRLTERLRPRIPLRDDDGVYTFSIWTMVRLEAGYDWEETERWLLDADRDLSRVDDPLSRGQVAVALSQFALARGRPVTAMRRAREAIDYIPRPDPSRRLPTLAWLCLVIGAALRGDSAAALEADAGYRASITEAPVHFLQPQEIAARAALLGVAVSWSSAAQVLLDGARANEGMLIDQAHLLYEALRAGARAATVASRLEPIAAAVDVPLVGAFASHAAALASDDGGRLVAAADAFEQIGAWLWAAEAAAQAGSAFTRAGRADSARRAVSLSLRCRDRCEDVRSPVLAAVDLAPMELTRREREIASLAAHGAANAEIAERLVLSVRTVETHLYRAMRKLGVTDRHELPDGL